MIVFGLLLQLKMNKIAIYATKLEVLILVVLALTVAGHVIYAPFVSYIDVLKFLFIFVVYLIGKNAGAVDERFYQNKTIAIFIFGFIPLFSFIVFYLAENNTHTVLFFSNKNNAVAFCLTCAILAKVMFPKLNSTLIYFYCIIFVIGFNTLGALLAFVVALLLVNVKFTWRNIVSLILVTVIFALIALYGEIPTLNRLSNVYQGANNFFSTYSLRDVADVSYGGYMALQGGNEDVSFFFRLKQWLEIFFIMVDGEGWKVIFGYGMKASETLTTIGLVPHNDWLRILFELGLLSFTCFLLLNLVLFKKIYRIDKCLATLYLTFLIYMFSENLINNFLITSFLYFSLTFTCYKKQRNPAQL